MKKILILLFLLCTYLFANHVEGNQKSQFTKTYKVGVLNQWEPYYLTDNNNQPTGYAIELFEKLASNLHLKYEYVKVENWKELWALVEKKQIDIIPNVGIALKRANHIDFTNTTDLFQISLYKNSELEQIKTIEDITTHSVGVVAKNVCTKLIDEKITSNKVLFTNFHESLGALSKNEINILCYPKPLVEYSLKELQIDNIESFGEPLKVIKRAVGVLKGNSSLVHALNKEFLRINANGEYYDIYNKWFGKKKDIEIDIEELLLILLVLTVVFLIVVYIIRSNNLLLTKKELNRKIEEVKSLNKRFSLAADKALAGYWEWDLEKNTLYLSPGWKSYLGYAENDLDNSFEQFKDLLFKNDYEPTMELVEKYLETKKGLYKAKFRLKHKDGSYKWVSAIGTISEENPNIFFGFHIDINDLTTTKETLIAQSKSVMMGEMLALIAHQFKQPLSVISMISSNQLANINLEETITNDMIEKDAEEVLKQILYLSETIDTFRDFLKPDRAVVKTTIESIIESSLSILNKSLLHNDIELVKNLSSTAELQLNHAELMQVFINIINNSKDAFKINNIENRVISIRTTDHKEYVSIEIEDTAGGIKEELIENIFDVYFTTKKQFGGTGVGLFIVKTIIQEHYNGSVKVENTQEGVKFTLTIPK